MEKIKWYEKTWVIVLCLLFFAPLGLYLIMRSKRHKTHIKVIFVVVFLFLLPLLVSFSIIGIPLYYFNYSRISSTPPLPFPQKIEEGKFRQGKIYLVPIGKVDKEFIKKLIPYVEERFRYETEIAAPLENKHTYWTYTRTLLDELDKYSAPTDAVRIIGITNLEIKDWDTLKIYWRESEGRLDPTLNRELYFVSGMYPYFPKAIYYAFYYSLIGPKVKGSNVFWLSNVHAPGKIGFISLYRLKEPIFFWKNKEVLLRRSVTEISFILGQSFGFTDCPHKYCVMKEHWDRVSLLDEKKSYLCLNCKLRFETMLAFHDYLITGDLKSQERFANEAIQRDPEDGTGHAVLGLVYKEKGEYKKAEHELWKALETSSENEIAFYLLGEVYYARAQESLKAVKSIQNYIDKEPEEILTFAKRSLISEPDNPFYRVLISFAYFKLEDYEEAEEEINKIKGKEAEALKLAINEMRWAKEKYQKAYQINRFLPSIFYNCAIDFGENKKYAEAIKLYKQAIRIHKDARFYTNLGLDYWNIKDYQKAIVSFREALKIDPNHATAYLGLGKAYGSLGDFEKAELYLRETLRLDPSYAFAYFYLGLIYEKEGNIENAVENYKRCVSLKGKEKEDFQGKMVNIEERMKTLTEEK
ncbi:MAG: tetratricopeptide repeat protein [Elusimicrobiota bacterium]